ncbi:MAG: hypothetical protein ACT4P7_19680 [Gemmatimonadaceae bacterium]
MTTASLRLATGRTNRVTRILKAGLTAGVCDLFLAMLVQVTAAGTINLVRILQSVAAGVLGREAARGGGFPTAGLGLVLHLLIATIWAAIFFVAVQRSAALRRATSTLPGLISTGLAYGVVIWSAMHFIVVPLSRANSGGGLSWITLMMISGHAVLVGLPIALIIGRSGDDRSTTL